jgi:hypothetical protein
MSLIFDSRLKWLAAAKALNLEDKSLYDLDKSQLKSASKIDEVQYISLRAIWTRCQPAMFEPDRWDLSLKQADRILDDDKSWKSYLTTIDRDTSGARRSVLPSPQLGTFSLVYYKQRILKNLTATKRDKIFTNTDYSPVAHRTRTMIRARAAVDSFQTPVKELMGLRIDGPSRAGGIGGVLMAGEEEDDAASGMKEEEPSTPMSEQTPRGRIKALTPSSPASFNIAESAEDESMVSSALVALLNALTIHVPAIQGHWTERRKRFVVETSGPMKIYEAITDGHLCNFEADTHSRVILEVKPVNRDKLPEVRRQESAQMAAWIFAEPNLEHTRYPNGIYRYVHASVFEQFAC